VNKFISELFVLEVVFMRMFVYENVRVGPSLYLEKFPCSMYIFGKSIS
jgi:hypothetical protein